jgi:hypothetical protein
MTPAWMLRKRIEPDLVSWIPDRVRQPILLLFVFLFVKDCADEVGYIPILEKTRNSNAPTLKLVNVPAGRDEDLSRRCIHI